MTTWSQCKQVLSLLNPYQNGKANKPVNNKWRKIIAALILKLHFLNEIKNVVTRPKCPQSDSYDISESKWISDFLNRYSVIDVQKQDNWYVAALGSALISDPIGMTPSYLWPLIMNTNAQYCATIISSVNHLSQRYSVFESFRTLLPKSSSCPKPAQLPNHAT